MRLPRFALLRCRYEGLSPSGQSVKGVRNDSAELAAMTTYCHSEERQYVLTRESPFYNVTQSQNEIAALCSQ